MNTKEPNTNPPHQFSHQSRHQLLKWSSWFLPPSVFSPLAGRAVGSTCRKTKKHHSAHPFLVRLIIAQEHKAGFYYSDENTHELHEPLKSVFYTLELRLLNVAAAVLIQDVEDILDFLGGLWGQPTKLEEPFVAEGVGGWKHVTQV